MNAARLLLSAVTFLGVSAFLPSAQADQSLEPQCYRFIIPEGPERTASILSPTTQQWCYQNLDHPAGSVFVFNVDEDVVKPELSAVVEADGVMTHGSLLAGAVTVHKLHAKSFNPFPIPLVQPEQLVSEKLLETSELRSSKQQVLSLLLSRPGSAEFVAVEEGIFEANVPDQVLPFRGYWWPYRNQPLSGTSSSPLAKYDSYVRLKTGQSAGAASWENARHKFKGITWEGHCNGWVASAILRAEPKVARKAAGMNASFTIADQKGILAEKDYCATVAFFGKRNNGRRGDNPRDIFPPLFHKTILYYIGQLGKPVALDYHGDSSVDNHIISGYKMTVTRRSESSFDVVAELRVHKYDSSRAQTPGVAPIYKRTYKYVLNVDPNGEITSGTWKTSNPDFLWVPLSPTTCGSNNPRVQEQYVQEILALPPVSPDADLISGHRQAFEIPVCPTLQGKYICKSGSDLIPLGIDQRTENGASVYKVNFAGMIEELVADGLPHTMTRDGEEMTYTTNCNGAEVAANITSKAVDYEMVTDILLKQNPDKNLSVGITISNTMGGETTTNQQDLSCRKIL